MRLAFQEWQGITVESVEAVSSDAYTPPKRDDRESREGDSGAALRERRDRLGVSVHALSRRSGLDRKTIARAEDNAPQTRRSTFEALHRALDEVEAARTATPAVPTSTSSVPKPGEVEFQVIREDGITVTVRGPSAHAEEIGASVVQLVRDFRDE